MNFGAEFFLALLQIIWVNVILSGDNAAMIVPWADLIMSLDNVIAVAAAANALDHR